VLAQPSGSRPEMRDRFHDNNMKGWARTIAEYIRLQGAAPQNDDRFQVSEE
jgi:hypothetical protein